MSPGWFARNAGVESVDRRLRARISSSGRCSVTATAEQLEHEHEDVEDVEEDARGDRHRGVKTAAPQSVEVEDREAAEDDEPEQRVDRVAVRDRNEERDNAEGN